MLNLKKFMRKKHKKINKAKEELKFQIEWKQIIFEINQFAKECSEKQARKESMFGRRQNSIIKGCLHDEYYNKYSH